MWRLVCLLLPALVTTQDYPSFRSPQLPTRYSPRHNYNIGPCGSRVCTTNGYTYRGFESFCALNDHNLKMIFCGEKEFQLTDSIYCYPPPPPPKPRSEYLGSYYNSNYRSLLLSQSPRSTYSSYLPRPCIHPEHIPYIRPYDAVPPPETYRQPGLPGLDPVLPYSFGTFDRPTPPTLPPVSYREPYWYYTTRRTPPTRRPCHPDHPEPTARPYSTYATAPTTEVSATEVSTKEVSSSEVSSPEVSSSEVTSSEVSSSEVSSSEVSSSEVSSSEVSTTEVSSSEVSSPEVSTTEVSSPEVSSSEVSTTEVSSSEVSTTEVSSTEASRSAAAVAATAIAFEITDANGQVLRLALVPLTTDPETGAPNCSPSTNIQVNTGTNVVFQFSGCIQEEAAINSLKSLKIDQNTTTPKSTTTSTAKTTYEYSTHKTPYPYYQLYGSSYHVVQY